MLSLFKKNNTGDTIEFKIREISQVSSFIGIPVELIYMPFRARRMVSFYFKLGAEFNFLCASKTTIQFYEPPTTTSDQNVVTHEVGNPDSFFSSIYGGAGIHLGKESKPGFNVEISVPAIFITSNSSSLTTPLFGAGLQFGFRIPI